VCADRSTTAQEKQTCMTGLSSQRNGAMRQVYDGLPDTEIEKVARTHEEKAELEYIGGKYTACLKESSTTQERDACATTFESDKTVLGRSDSKEDIMARHYGSEMATGAVACVEAGGESTRKKQCRADAKTLLVQAGMNEREYAGTKRLGEDEEAARAWFACKLNDAMTDSDCEVAARAAFEAVSGTTDQASWDARKAKIEQLGDAKRRGERLQVRRKDDIEVEVRTDATACSSDLKIKFKSKLLALLISNRPGNKTLEDVTGCNEECRVVDGNAEVCESIGATGLSGTDMTTVSDEVQSLLASNSQFTIISRRLSQDDTTGNRISKFLSKFLSNADKARRLNPTTVTISNVYAAQGTELCVAGDTLCLTGATTVQVTTRQPLGTTSGGVRFGSLASIGLGVFSLLVLSM